MACVRPWIKRTAALRRLTGMPRMRTHVPRFTSSFCSLKRPIRVDGLFRHMSTAAVSPMPLAPLSSRAVLRAVRGVELWTRRHPVLARRNPSLQSHLTSFRRMFSTQQVVQAQAIASANPDSAAHQEALYETMLDEHPTELIKRFESKRYASSDKCLALYYQALLNVNATHRLYAEERAQLQRMGVLQSSDDTTREENRQRADRERERERAEYYEHTRRERGNQYDGRGSDPSRPVHVRVESQEGWKMFFSRLAPTVLFILFFYYFMIPSLTPFKNDKNSVHEAEEVDARFSDVVGCDDAKADLAEVVDFLRNPDKFQRLGGKLPKGVLLMGPPGTGKTLLARAVAGEADVPFFFASGSEFEEMFVGLGARRIRELFKAAKEKTPCLVFIDEIDAVGGSRKSRADLTPVRQTLNQLLTELDGFEDSRGMIVIGATNFPELLDKALVRPGRFDKKVTMELPDVKGRKEIFQLYLDKISADPNVDPLVLARGTPGCSGAEIYNIVNAAAVRASVLGLDSVRHSELEWAKDKVLMGPERKGMVMKDSDRKLTAYHEGGHALVALLTNGAQPIHKATIMPRGQALGMVMQLPHADIVSQSKEELLARMDVCMGGRVAEELIFGPEKVTTGASSDFKQANAIARAMVMQFGMSKAVGQMVVNDQNDLAVLSPDTKRVMDEEIRNVLQASYSRVQELLNTRRKDLDRVADALLEYETLSGEDLQQLLGGGTLHKEL